LALNRGFFLLMDKQKNPHDQKPGRWLLSVQQCRDHQPASHPGLKTLISGALKTKTRQQQARAISPDSVGAPSLRCGMVVEHDSKPSLLFTCFGIFISLRIFCRAMKPDRCFSVLFLPSEFATFRQILGMHALQLLTWDKGPCSWGYHALF